MSVNKATILKVLYTFQVGEPINKEQSRALRGGFGWSNTEEGFGYWYSLVSKDRTFTQEDKEALYRMVDMPLTNLTLEDCM